jgi:hypothetical protein
MPNRDRTSGESVWRRNRGLRRVSSTTYGVGLAAAAGAIVLGTNYAQASISAASTTPVTQTVPSTTGENSQPAPTPTLQTPTQAPAPAQQAPQTTSGAS